MLSRILLVTSLALTACASHRAESAAAQSASVRPDLAALSSDVPRADRKLVRNAWFRIELDDEDQIPAAVRRAGALADQLGGYVLSERTAGAVLRVPGGKYEQASDSVAALGRVVERSSKVDDITAEFTDLAIRIENARKMQKRLQELLGQAQSIEAALAVEREMARVTETLERLEGQMRLAQEETSFATIDVAFEEKVTPGPVGWVFYGLYHGVKWLFVWD